MGQISFAGGGRRGSGNIRAIRVIRGKKQTKQNERKVMNNKFDELAKGLAQSVTRRQALKQFGVGLAGMALACFGLANKTEATPPHAACYNNCVDGCLISNPGAKSFCAGTCKAYCDNKH
jgi:hypothetical protein